MIWKKKWISWLLSAVLILQTGGSVCAEESIPVEEEVLLLEETEAPQMIPEEDPAPEAETVPSEESIVSETETVPEEESTVPETETVPSEAEESTVPETETVPSEAEESTVPETEMALLQEEAGEEAVLFTADPEGLLEDPEGEELQVITMTETVELSDPFVASGNAPRASFRMFSMEQYNGCFGNQLSGSAREFYDSRVSYYVTQRNAGAMILTYSSQNSPYTFTAEIISDGTKNTINKETEEYQAVQQQVLFDLQSSLDAFVYDHPEIFWLRGGSCSYNITAVGSSGNWIGYVSKLTYTPSEAFAGASGMISEFDSAVRETAGGLQAKADLNGDGTAEPLELIMTAHDHLCQRFYYDRDAYQNYESSGDYRIFCAAGGFLDSVGTGVVCEGYAKSFKVICDQWGIPCVLIGGTVTQNGKTEGHMWNGVYLNGKWYLMDVTWDDSSTGFSNDYFMVGNTLSGRVSSGYFGGASFSTCFVYPQLSAEALVYCPGMQHIQLEDTVIAPTCTEQGYTRHTCTHCKAVFDDQYVPAEPDNHTYQAAVTKPTCTEAGYTTYTCSRCKASYREVNGNKLGHDYRKTVTAPTCTTEGYTTYTCSRCKDSYREGNGNKLGHDYKKTVTAPTCTTEGYTTYTCSRCKNSYTGDVKKKTAHTFSRGVCTRCKATESTHTFSSSGICTRCGIGNSIVNASVSSIRTQIYGAGELTPEVTVKFGTNVLKKGIDYTVTYRNNINPGTAYVTVTGTGIYRGTVSRSFQITKRSVSGLSVSAIADRTYNGNYQKPAVTIRNNGVKLKKNTDYTVTYSNHKKIGRAVITIKGKGKYTGSRKIYFSIVPKTPVFSKLRSSAKKKLTVSWKRVSGVSGYQIQYGKSSSFRGAKTVTAGSGSTSKTISKLTGGKVYYVRVRSYKKVSGKTYYSSWSSVKKTTVKK